MSFFKVFTNLTRAPAFLSLFYKFSGKSKVKAVRQYWKYTLESLTRNWNIHYVIVVAKNCEFGRFKGSVKEHALNFA